MSALAVGPRDVKSPYPLTEPPSGSVHAMSGIEAIQKPVPPVIATPTVMRVVCVPVPTEPFAAALIASVEAAGFRKFFLAGVVVVVCTPTVCQVEPMK